MGLEQVTAPFAGHQFVAITGTPAAGKSTLAEHLAREFSAPVLSAGDVARSVDGFSRQTGAMAAEDLFREEWSKRVAAFGDGPLILEGIPRKESQVELLPPSTLIVVLLCGWEVSERRMYERGRIDDGFARERYEAQLTLFGMDNGLRTGGTWVTDLAPAGYVLRTDEMTPEQVTAAVLNAMPNTQAWATHAE